ncbi:MAG: septal ring lytic transglycosylase RlpA family protein [Spirochaetaceae bacterium]|nr:septal ring lytic transglycosylase RlpA family protein [Spirochaetaceae bacterium]
MKRFLLILVLGLFFSLLCSAQTQTGNATYNASKTGFFISHPSLSFNTKVRVTNLSNNRSVEATVNGRIPIRPAWIAAISRDVGDAIGMARTGMTRVRIEELAFHPAPPPAADPVQTPPAVAIVPPAEPDPQAVVPPTPVVPEPAVPVPAPVVVTPPVVVPPPPAAAPPVVVPPPSVAAPPVVVPASPVIVPAEPAAPPPAPVPAPAATTPASAVSPAVPAAPPPAPLTPAAVPQPPAAGPAQSPPPPVRIITEEEYVSFGCPVTNCANTPLLVAILILLILVIMLLVVIIILILHRFPFLPKHYRVWLRRHVLFIKRQK